MKNSSWNFHAIFLIQISLANLVFLEEIFYCQVFFFCCLTLYLQIALDCFCSSNWKPVSSPFPFWTLCPRHQRSKWPISARCSEEAQGGSLYRDGLWLVKPSRPQQHRRSREEGDLVGYLSSSLWMDWQLGAWRWLLRSSWVRGRGGRMQGPLQEIPLGSPISWLVWFLDWVCSFCAYALHDENF